MVEATADYNEESKNPQKDEPGIEDHKVFGDIQGINDIFSDEHTIKFSV